MWRNGDSEAPYVVGEKQFDRPGETPRILRGRGLSFVDEDGFQVLAESSWLGKVRSEPSKPA
jgi:hypothetical protein